MSSKAQAKAVDPKDLAPNWKVLQMKMKEDKAKEPLKPERPPFNKKKAKKRPAPSDGPEKSKMRKFAEETPVGRSDNEEIGELTNTLAIDCEYVGTGDDGRDDALARVSIVNEEGKVVYDKYVKAKAKVTDYRTHVSGIRPAHLVDASRFEDVQREVHKMLEGRIVVGHALHNDFRVMALNHPRKLTRDTARCKAIRALLNPPTSHPSLKGLAKTILGIEIQQGEHDSIIDARVALRIYLNMKKQWEAEIKRYGKN